MSDDSARDVISRSGRPISYAFDGTIRTVQVSVGDDAADAILVALETAGFTPPLNTKDVRKALQDAFRAGVKEALARRYTIARGSEPTPRGIKICDDILHEIIAAKKTGTAASALEAMASEVERLKATFDAGTVAQILKVTQVRAEAAEAERDRLKAVGQKLLAKFDHPTASVTQWDVDELRAALGDGKR